MGSLAGGGGYVPTAAAGGTSSYTPSAAAMGTNGYLTSSSSATQSTGGYVPSAAAMGNLTITPSSSGTSSYTPSAAAMGTATGGSTGYVPSAAAMGTSIATTSSYTPSASTSSYKPSTAATTSGYVPSAAAMGSVGTTTSSYTPSTSASSYKPFAAATTGGYVPSATAMGSVGATTSSYAPSASASSYKPSAAATTGGYVPSAAAMGGGSAATSTYTPSAAASSYTSAATGYVPSAAASGGCQFSAPGAGHLPSLFSAPPANKPAKPSHNTAQHQQPKPHQTKPQRPKPKPSIFPPQTQSQPYNEPPPPQQHSQPQHYSQPGGVLSAEERQQFEENVPQELKQADVWMISGCEDKQTSADISNVNSFQLPNPHGRAGGACTAALLGVLHENDKQQSNYTFQDVLMKMRGIIKSKRLSQIPQLSSANPIDMKTKFQIVPDGASGRRRAVIIGINYKGQQGELRGCHNDAFNMQKYVQDRYGFQQNDTVMLIDDGRHTSPTRANIISAYKKVVAESRPGDSIFLHYSGHGTKVPDQNGDEDDGYDEALVPLDFKRTGHILDDDLYKIIVEGVSPGVHVMAVMDCCHSGTILDLPYIFLANGKFSKMEVDHSYLKRKKFMSTLGNVAGNVGTALLVGGLLNAIF